MPIDFRPARVSDAHDIARFFQLTSEGMADYIWSKLAAPGEALLSVGASRYAREQGDFSYKNCLMATFEGRVIGMMHSYALREPADGRVETDPVLAPYSDMEIPDTLYISSLALDEAWRSQGLGQQFLAYAYDRANQLGLNGTLSLVAAAKSRMSGDRDNIWKPTLPQPEAQQIVRDLLVMPDEKLVDADTAAVRRAVRHVVE